MDPQSKLNAIAQQHLGQNPAVQKLGMAARAGFGTDEPQQAWGTSLQDQRPGGIPFNQNPADQAELAKKKAAFEAAMAARGLQ